jgi:hypothetical protein
MKLPLFVLGLAALALATSRIPNPRWLEEIVPETQIRDTEFRSGREYQFVYNGQLLTGLPQSSKQHAATRIQAVCSLVFKTETKCLLKCTHMRMGKLNQHVPEPRKMVPFAAFQEVPIERELLEQLQAPIKFRYENGLITDIVFDGTEQPWSANIKRGVLNMLQVNLAQRGRTDTTEEALLRNDVTEPISRENDFFTATEKTLEGECECDYTVIPRPTGGLKVTKSINFEKCLRRPEIKYNYRFSTFCPTCDKRYTSDEKMLRSSTVISFDIKGTPEQFLIKKSVCESQYVYIPFNEQANVITSYVNQTLELVKSGPITGRVNEPQNVKRSDSQMLYTSDWDVLKEKFFQEGEDTFHDKTPYSEIRNKVEFVGKILQRLVRYVSESVEEQAPRQFVRLVKVLRMCKKQELKEIHQTFFVNMPTGFTPEDHKKIKDLLVDGLAAAGTKDCVTHLVNKIKRREIHPIKAALSIKNLISVRVPSEQIVNELLKLSENEVCKRNLFLKQSVHLTMGSVIHALCGEHEDKLARENKKTSDDRVCPRALKERLVKTLFTKLRNAETTSEKVLCMKTIANAGLDLSVFELEKIIKNVESNPTMVRMEAVMALRRLTDVMPRKLQKMLMPIFMNQRELPEIRMLCMYQVLRTLPERPVLDQIARQLTKERSRQVLSFVLSHLMTLANSTNPCEKRVADNLKLSLRRAKVPSMWNRGSSKLIKNSMYSDKYDRGLSTILGTITSKDSYLPRLLAFGTDMNSKSQWFQSLFTVGVVQKGVEKWIRKIYSNGGPIERDLDEVLRRSPRSIKTMSPQNELKKIFEKLDITERSIDDERNPLLMPFMRIMNQDIGFLPISMESMPESIRDMLKNDRIDIGSIERSLEQGINMDFYQAFLLTQQSRKIPTTLGLPIRLSIKTPIVMRLNGQIKAQMEPKNKIRMVKLNINLKPSIALTMSEKVECWSPVLNSGLKVISQVKAFTPINVEMKLDTRKNPVETELKWKPHRNAYEILTAHTRPITCTSVWPKSMTNWQEPEERTVMGEEWTRMNKFDEEFGERSVGMKIRVRGSWHTTPVQKVAGTPFCPYSGPNKLRVTVQPGHEMPQEVVMKVTGKLFQHQDKELKANFETFYDSQDSTFFRTSVDDSESEPEPEPEMRFESSELINNQMLIKIFTRGSSVKRTCEIKTNCQCNERQRHCKCVLDLKRSPIPEIESSIWKLRCELETLFPETPYKFSELTQDKNLVCQMKANWGEGSSNKKNVEVKILGQRSEEQMKLLRKNQMTYNSECSSPICQFEQLKRASVLTEYKIDVDFKNLDKMEQSVTNKLYRLLKHTYFWQTNVDQIKVQNTRNQVRARITIDPKSFNSINVTIKTPFETCKINEIPLGMKIRPINIRSQSQRMRSTSEYLQKWIEPTMSECKVRRDTVRTFDGMRLRLPFSQCYSVLAKDCSRPENPRFAVLVKKINSDSSKKQVKILTRENRIVLTSELNEQFKIEINGQVKLIEQVQDIVEHGHVVLRVEKQGPVCKVSLPEAGIKVYYDGYVCNVKMSQTYRNVQCGLCGHFDGEMEDELRNPSSRLVDLPEFHRSWLLQEQCQVEEELNDQSQYWLEETEQFQPDWRSTKSGSCPRLNEISLEKMNTCEEQCNGDGDCTESKKCCFNGCSHVCVESKERTTSRRNNKERRPVLGTKVIEHGHELCFSKQPVALCPRNTFPKKYEEEKKVVYCCLPRSDPQAEVYHRQALKNLVVQQVQNLPASFTETELIPELCTKY